MAASNRDEPVDPHSTEAKDHFAKRLLAWWDVHGRKDLPWQLNRTPYRVWVSEIMLQQTTVAAVVPYFERFMARFPDVETLADAGLDEVLHLWSGLGYYARARSLHRAAGIVVTDHGGRLPESQEALMALPGVGRSTAAAIAAQAFGRRAAILDGNVKRVLSRIHRVAGQPSSSATIGVLWDLAEAHTPADRVADYTQAIMDLGATLCRRRDPSCPNCPVQDMCGAFAQGDIASFPERAVRRERRAERRRFFVLTAPESDVLRRTTSQRRHLGRPLVTAGAGRRRIRNTIPRSLGRGVGPGRATQHRTDDSPRLHPLRSRRRAGLHPLGGEAARPTGTLDRPRPPSWRFRRGR